jgi:hypothetical protein
VHAAFVAFAALGGLLVLRWPRVAFLHVPAVLWGAWVELASRTCPLTPLENALRRAAGEAGYTGSFVERYLTPVVYPDGLSPNVQWALAAALLLVNVAAYTAVLRRRYAVRGG